MLSQNSAGTVVKIRPGESNEPGCQWVRNSMAIGAKPRMGKNLRIRQFWDRGRFVGSERRLRALSNSSMQALAVNPYECFFLQEKS
jgi:hypothetical protein